MIMFVWAEQLLNRLFFMKFDGRQINVHNVHTWQFGLRFRYQKNFILCYGAVIKQFFSLYSAHLLTHQWLVFFFSLSINRLDQFNHSPDIIHFSSITNSLLIFFSNPILAFMFLILDMIPQYLIQPFANIFSEFSVDVPQC